MKSTSKTIKTKAFSNIAFVKYWGKLGRQIPMNPSISMLIPQCHTEMTIDYEISDSLEIHSFLFENKENEAFKNRFIKYLNDIEDVYPLGKKLKLSIKSSNNFPHSAGIASSASAFAAFAKALIMIEAEYNDQAPNQNRESMLARLGSGSACRSISNTAFNLWGKTKMDLGSDDYGLDLDSQKYCFESPLIDTILVVDANEKKISSSAGHSLMHGHFYREARIEQAHENIRTLLGAIENNDFDLFGEVIENEAMSLHAMMMTSMPSYTLLAPNTLKLIEILKTQREKGQCSVYFTLDAGPNLHLIYQAKDQEQVQKFIETHAKDYTLDIIWGQVSE